MDNERLQTLTGTGHGSEIRHRSMPIVPEPFERLSESGNSLAKDHCKFFPNFNIRRYLEQQNKDYVTTLSKRATVLSRHATQNFRESVSEFTWEADMRTDVFGQIRTDPRLRIDKRAYEFKVTGPGSSVSIKRKIPDATMGLHTYFENDKSPPHASFCSVEGCNDAHIEINCGLIVDGIWGNADVIFPWAVYEAKKQWGGPQEAEPQIYHAFQTYLALLDDLARDPNNVAKYQSSESRQYQMFGFTSEGYTWTIYLAWHFLDSCHVETIWSGRVGGWHDARILICLVDQIHTFAVTHHREFVIQHLEPWLKRRDDEMKAMRHPGYLNRLTAHN